MATKQADRPNTDEPNPNADVAQQRVAPDAAPAAAVRPSKSVDELIEDDEEIVAKNGPMLVIARAEGYDGVKVRRPGEVFEMPKGTKIIKPATSWIVPAQSSEAQKIRAQIADPDPNNPPVVKAARG